MTATEASNPVKNVVLVHGVFANASGWNKVIPLLQAKGLHVAAVQNPPSLRSKTMLPLQSESSPRKTAQSFWTATPTAEP
jgi:alpha-beta hydrolase superfamily lysophospholipase